MLKIQFKNNAKSAVWLVEPKMTIGSKGTNELVVDKPGVAEQHFEIAVEGDNLTLCPIAGNDVELNGEPATKKKPIAIQDLISFSGVELEVIDPKHQKRVKPKEGSATGWAIKANHPSLENKIFPLRERNLLGRSSECDIAISAAHLSRRHAELIVRDGQLFVNDLQSANGTFLNGERVTKARVRRGDELRFDTLPFGIVGPADDMDRTTVRSVKRPEQSKIAKPARPRVVDEQQQAVKKEKQRQLKENLPQDDSADVWEETSSTFQWLIIGGVIVMGVVGALFYFQGNLV